MLRRLLMAAAALASVSFAMPAAAADPTPSSLPLQSGGTTYNECSYSDGTHLWVCHLTYGWDYTNNRPKAAAVDPTTGNAQVVIQPSPSITTISATLATAGTQTPWTCFKDTKIAVGLTGTGYNVSAPLGIPSALYPIVYRATTAPISGAEASYANAAGLTPWVLYPGNVTSYEEPGMGWWSVLIPAGAFSTGSYTVTMSGKSC